MSYIGSTPTTQSFIAGTDYFNGNGSTVAFTMSRSVNTVNDIEVTVNNVQQIPTSYTVSGTTLTFSAAPSSGTNNIYVRYLSTTLQSITITGTLAVASGGTGVTTSTGTGSVVLNTSPTLITPALGTPTSGTLTNCTFPTLNQNTSGTAAGLSATLAVASGGTGVTSSTGTGSVVLSTSPTLTTPALGTPSALVGTNITGTASGLTAGNVTTNANLTGAVTSVGNATSLGSFTSAQLLAALTDETGTGANVFATSPTLVTPILGTPTSGTLTNCTFPTLNQNTTGSAATFTSTSQNSQFNSVGVGTAGSTTAGEIRATNNITAYYSSDIKFKENVQDIPNALSAVNEIGGKLFDWKDSYIQEHGGEDGYFVQKHDFGVIAQDVLAHFPVATRTRPDGSLAVDYEKLCALAFAAIKELNAKVMVLENFEK